MMVPRQLVTIMADNSTSFHRVLIFCSGNTHDDILLAKIETVYSGSGDPGSSMVCFLGSAGNFLDQFYF